jgi:hypothetical protein
VPRIVAVDWSGAMRGASRSIWLAEAADERLVRLESGRTREQVCDFLAAEAAKDPELVVGLDFAFSLPAWFLQRLGIAAAPELWEQLDRIGEDWIRDPPAPFWRSQRRAPESAPDDWQWRRTELEAESSAGIRAKSVFQLVGAGHVGTGSLRGMPILHRLRAHGFRVWPFDEPAFPLVVEIYPRLLTGAVVKSDPAARVAYLERYPQLEPGLRALAAADENAFDAAVSALVMAAWPGEWSALPREPAFALEGAIWR